MTKTSAFRLYLALSLTFHFILAGVFFVVERIPHHTPHREAVDINFISPDELQKTTDQMENLRKKIVLNKGQIVEQSDASPQEEAPEDTRFLSAKNKKVAKQTVAAQRGQFQNIKKSSLQSSSPKESQQKKQITKDLFRGFNSGEALQRQKIVDKESSRAQGQGPNESASNAAADVSQTNDYIKDVDTGLETVLNTREFKYYSYYNRIRQQLSQHWEGRVREKLTRLFKEGRAPAATSKDRITKLMIVLNDKGTLVRVQVLSDSGVRDLDDAAVEAFRAAAPFPNPPKGIVEGDGTVKIRWDFVLET